MHENNGGEKMKRTVAIIMSFILAAMIFSACGGASSAGKAADSKPESTADSVKEESKTEKPTQEPTAEPESESAYYFKDLEIVTKDYSIKITDWKIINPGEQGNEYGDSPVIAFWYDTTNISGKEIDPMSAWIYAMTAIQDNNPNAVNELNVAMLPDTRFTDTQMQTIKAGGSVECAVAYELSDTETNVTLTAKNNLIGPELGAQTFPIK